MYYENTLQHLMVQLIASKSDMSRRIYGELGSTGLSALNPDDSDLKSVIERQLLDAIVGEDKEIGSFEYMDSGALNAMGNDSADDDYTLHEFIMNLEEEEEEEEEKPRRVRVRMTVEAEAKAELQEGPPVEEDAQDVYDRLLETGASEEEWEEFYDETRVDIGRRNQKSQNEQYRHRNQSSKMARTQHQNKINLRETPIAEAEEGTEQAVSDSADEESTGEASSGRAG